MKVGETFVYRYRTPIYSKFWLKFKGYEYHYSKVTIQAILRDAVVIMNDEGYVDLVSLKALKELKKTRQNWKDI